MEGEMRQEGGEGEILTDDQLTKFIELIESGNAPKEWFRDKFAIGFKFILLHELKELGYYTDTIAGRKFVGHYTSVPRFVEIFSQPISFEQRSPLFLASDLHFVNDTSEGEKSAPYAKWKGKSRTREELMNDHCVASFCRVEDDLPMWLAYGQAGRGVCIELSSAFLFFNDAILSSPVLYTLDDATGLLPALKKWVRILEALGHSEEVIAGFFFAASLLRKDKAFTFESEYRVITHPGNTMIMHGDTPHLRRFFPLISLDLALETPPLQLDLKTRLDSYFASHAAIRLRFGAAISDENKATFLDYARACVGDRCKVESVVSRHRLR